MARGRAAVAIGLSAAEGDELKRLARRPSTAQALALRARMIVMAGAQDSQAVSQLTRRASR